VNDILYQMLILSTYYLLHNTKSNFLLTTDINHGWTHVVNNFGLLWMIYTTDQPYITDKKNV